MDVWRFSFAFDLVQCFDCIKTYSDKTMCKMFISLTIVTPWKCQLTEVYFYVGIC